MGHAKNLGHSARFSSLVSSVLLTGALFAGACDVAPLEGTGAGGDNQVAPAAQGGASPVTSQPDGEVETKANAFASIAKIDPGLLSGPNAFEPGDVIVLLDEPSMVELPDSPGPPALPGAQAPLTSVGPYHLEAQAARFDLAKSRLVTRLGARRLVTMNRFQNLPAMHLRVESLTDLTALAADPAVTRIVRNEKLVMFDTVPADLSLINQPKAAAAGKLGAGATVAVLDTGTDYTRAPFSCTAAGAAGCPVVYAADFATQDNSLDDNGHGTNVSGIVHMVAPAAQIVALDVFNGSSAATTDIMAAIDWCIQNKVKYNIVAINMSLGGGLSATPCPTDALSVSITRARAAGILSAVASGNAGTTNAIASPACGPDAVSVGAVHAANLGSLQWSSCGDATTRPDQVACFSCSSSFLTVLAPGVMISAAGITMSGTSQATPHVAGAIAVLRSAFPLETPTATVARLTTYGVPVKDPRNSITKPRIDLFAALSGVAAAPAPALVAAPLGTISLAAKAAYTKTALVTVALATTSGMATQVCVSESTSCTTWVAAAASLSFTLSAGDGNKTVLARWKDAAGNVSATPATASIVLDTTAPVGGALAGTALGLKETFTWSGFSDAGSGLAGYRLVTGTTGAIAAGCQTGTIAYEGTALTFAQTLPTAGTLYARVCGKDALGNMSAGSALTVALAAPAAGTRTAVLVGADNTTQIGTATGGTAYNDACPAGQVLVGFAGSLSNATVTGVNRQVTGHCGVVQITGTVVTIKAGPPLATRGLAGTSAWTRDCPVNQAIAGFSGRAGLLVDQLVLSCAPLVASGSTTGAVLTVGTASALPAVGGTGGTATAQIKCPAGEVATTARVRTGDNLDAFGLACGKPTVGAN
jgi:subtilisin family serine protease